MDFLASEYRKHFLYHYVSPTERIQPQLFGVDKIIGGYAFRTNQKSRATLTPLFIQTRHEG